MRNKEKWTALSKALFSQPGTYYRKRLPRRMLYGRFLKQETAVREDPTCQSIHGFGALWPTRRNTDNRSRREIGTLWVDPAHRGNGMTKDLLDELIDKAPEGAELFLITKEESVMRAVVDRGFQAVTAASFDGDLFRWAGETGMSGRLPDTVYLEFPRPKQGERWLFMRT